MPREWLDPARLKSALAKYRADERAKKATQTARTTVTFGEELEVLPMVQLPNFPGAPVSPNEADAWLRCVSSNRRSLDTLKSFGVSDMDALEVLYTQRWALGRYACDAENAKKFLIESKAIDRGEVDSELWDELKHEWESAARNGD